jgi:hypothetical protein
MLEGQSHNEKLAANILEGQSHDEKLAANILETRVKIDGQAT